LHVGKTLGFLLPAFLNILEMQKTVVVQARRSRHVPPRVLVVAPTRELAQQIAGESLKYRGAGINTITLFGGAARSQQAMELRAGADIVVATPGRCNDFAESGELDLSRIECIVLDEADRMYAYLSDSIYSTTIIIIIKPVDYYMFYRLDMGFEPQIRGIISQLPKNIQTGTLPLRRQSCLYASSSSSQLSATEPRWRSD
jgi:superfamily II DNA/RNA helicase